MDGTGESMDNICVFLTRIARWIDAGQVPALPFVGRARGRFFNPPKPHIEVCFADESGEEEIRIGDLRVTIPARHVSVHSVHFGNYSDAGKLVTWCLFFDVAGVDEFRELEERPVFACMPVSRPEMLSAAFQRVALVCRLPGSRRPEYLHGPAAYAPSFLDDSHLSYRLHVKGAVMGLLGCLLDEYRISVTGEGTRLPKAVEIAQEFIVSNYQDPGLDLPAVAAAAHLSVDHFGRIFRRHTRVSPMRYLRQVRIDQSKLLLVHTGLLVEEIARDVGFTDQFYFSRVFRSVVGVSPTEFRRDRGA
jgi:AraC-like DNA-binding protein